MSASSPSTRRRGSGSPSTRRSPTPTSTPHWRPRPPRRSALGRRCRSPSGPSSCAGSPRCCGTRSSDLALLVTREMGKPLAEARGRGREVRDRLRLLRRARGRPSSPTSRSRPTADRSWIAYEPVGVVLAVMPWNFPLWQVLPLRRPGAHGRQRGAAQALPQHHRLRAGASAICSPRPVRPRGCSARSSSPSRTSPPSCGG